MQAVWRSRLICPCLAPVVVVCLYGSDGRRRWLWITLKEPFFSVLPLVTLSGGTTFVVLIPTRLPTFLLLLLLLLFHRASSAVPLSSSSLSCPQRAQQTKNKNTDLRNFASLRRRRRGGDGDYTVVTERDSRGLGESGSRGSSVELHEEPATAGGRQERGVSARRSSWSSEWG